MRIISAEKLEKNVEHYQTMVSAGKINQKGFSRILFDISDVFTEIERTLKEDIDRTILNNAIDMLRDEETTEQSGCGRMLGDKCVIF